MGITRTEAGHGPTAPLVGTLMSELGREQPLAGFEQSPAGTRPYRLGPIYLVIFSIVAMAGNASLVSPPGSGLLLSNLQVRRSDFLARGCGFVRLRRADVAGSYVWQISLGGSCASGLGTAAVSFIVQDGLSLIWRKPTTPKPRRSRPDLLGVEGRHGRNGSKAATQAAAAGLGGR
jgi:hypothetical protein